MQNSNIDFRSYDRIQHLIMFLYAYLINEQALIEQLRTVLESVPRND